MIRFVLGLILILGVAGGIDSAPAEFSLTDMMLQGLFVITGFALAISGVSSMKE